MRHCKRLISNICDIWKTAFLVLLGTACRRSELHALDLRHIKHSDDWSSVEFYPLPDFRAKNQHLDDSSLPQTYSIQALGTFSSENSLLCPVRALCIYL